MSCTCSDPCRSVLSVPGKLSLSAPWSHSSARAAGHGTSTDERARTTVVFHSHFTTPSVPRSAVYQQKRQVRAEGDSPFGGPSAGARDHRGVEREPGRRLDRDRLAGETAVPAA